MAQEKEEGEKLFTNAMNSIAQDRHRKYSARMFAMMAQMALDIPVTNVKTHDFHIVHVFSEKNVGWILVKATTVKDNTRHRLWLFPTLQPLFERYKIIFEAAQASGQNVTVRCFEVEATEFAASDFIVVEVSLQKVGENLNIE